MFETYSIETKLTMLDLTANLILDPITRGRRGGIMVEGIQPQKGLEVPIVRTTTPYTSPALLITPPYVELRSDIQKSTFDCSFNNVMIEIYTSEYTTMGYHTDQSLDLVPGSMIGIFSSYADPSTSSYRLLQIKNKTTLEEWSIPLTHNSCVMFSTETNQHHVHRIVLPSNEANISDWLGITWRLSQTYIGFVDERPFFQNFPDIPLVVATSEQKKLMCRWKRQENMECNFTYPECFFTMSPSDCLPPQ